MLAVIAAISLNLSSMFGWSKGASSPLFQLPGLEIAPFWSVLSRWA
jgi:hypothetical protein